MNRYGLNRLTSALLIALATACGTEVAKPNPKAAIGPITPEKLLLTGTVDGKVTESFRFTNTGTAALTYQVEESSDWLTLTAGASGTLEAGAEQTVSLDAACGSVAESRTAQLTVRASDATLEARTLDVLLSCTMGRSLVVTLTGLPANTDANVTVTGPQNFSRTLTASTALTDLQPGEYTVAATRVTVDDLPYDATPETQSVAVTVAQGAAATIVYAVAKGSLDVNVTLPGVATPRVTITGPANFEQVVNATTHLTDLVEGTYTVTAEDVKDGLATFVPTPSTQTKPVVKGQTASVDIAYALKHSSLEITVEGLPAGLDPALTVTTPSGSYIEVHESTTLNDLDPGTYFIDAGEVTDGDFIYGHEQASLDVSSDAAGTITVTYSLLPGTFDLAIAGLPAGATPSVLIEGPNSYSQTFSADVTGESVEPGDYTLTPADVTLGNVIYRASTAQKHVASKTTSTFDVQYAVVPSALTVTITGLPTGVDANVSIVGPNGFQETLTATWNSTTLLPGAYTITASDVTIGTTIYRGSGAGFTLGSLNDLGVTVDYVIVPGALTVTVDGLPVGTDGNVTVTGPNSFSQAVTTTWSSATLFPGDYTITPADVTVGTAIYRAVSSTVSLGSEDDVSKVITYAAIPATLTVTIAGLPPATDGNVTVTGPNSFSQAVNSTWNSATLTPGTYTITPADVTIGSTIYRATGTTADLASNDDISKTITYAIVPGKLTVTVAGLPVGTDGDVTVTGPNSFSQAVTTTWNSETLTPGTYTITAADVTIGSAVYHASGTTVDLGSENDLTRTITYAVVPAKLTVTIAGLPAGTDANVTVTGPDSFSQTLTVTTALPTLAPGAYTITANDVTVGEVTYWATSTTATLASNDDVSKTITYASGATLTVNISGLPNGVNGAVKLTGPGGFSQTLTATTTLTSLTPGDYALTPDEVFDGLSNYMSGSEASLTLTNSVSSYNVTYAQAWSKLIAPSGTTSTQVDVNDLYVDAQGNTFVVGYTTGALEGQTSLGGLTDAFLIKYNARGELVWARQFGSASNDYADSIAIDELGAIYIAGETLGEFGSYGSTTNVKMGNGDVYLAKFTSDGTPVWTRMWGTVPRDQSSRIALEMAVNGSVYLVGETSGRPSNPTNATALTTTDGLVLSLNRESGELNWVTNIAATSSTREVANDAVVASNGDLIVTGLVGQGAFSGTGVTVNTTNISPHTDMFLIRYAKDGTRLWVRQVGDEYHDVGNGVALDADGNIYVAGQWNYTPSTTTGKTNNTGSSFVRRFASDGSDTGGWAQYIDTLLAAEQYSSIAINAAGQIAVTGRFDTAGYAIAGQTNAGGTDGFVAVYSTTDGTRTFLQQFGSTSTDVPRAVVWGQNNTMVVSGWSNAGLPGTTFKGSQDGWVVKLKP